MSEYDAITLNLKESQSIVQCLRHTVLLCFKVTDCLTTVKSINKTDAITLLSTFSVSTAAEENCDRCHAVIAVYEQTQVDLKVCSGVVLFVLPDFT